MSNKADETETKNMSDLNGKNNKLQLSTTTRLKKNPQFQKLTYTET